MTNESKDRRLLELLHDLTHKDCMVVIQNDFPGMLNVTVGGRSHQHLGQPHGDLKELDRMLRNYLAECLNEESQQAGDKND